jgi:chorismate mutase
VNESLQKRLAELSLEIRNYPTPIARCDEQLAALLDERSRLIQKLTTSGETGCSPLALWINDGGFHAA